MKRQRNKTTRQKHRDSRGSVLIFVVGVLVLLALSAMAYLISTRTDRGTTKQNEYNVQVDLLLDGVRRSVREMILADTSVPNQKNLNPVLNPNSDSAAQEQWLSVRVPTPYGGNVAVPAYDNAGAVPVVWRQISASTIFSSSFETPTGIAYPPSGDYDPRNNAIPTSLGGKPALMFPPKPGAAGGTPISNRYLAGDADGDGIADGGYVRLPIGPVNGITYYAVIRIIDNSSAVNVNTAFSRDFDANVNGPIFPPTGFFTSSVGLRELLRTYDSNPANWNTSNGEFWNVNKYKVDDGSNSALFYNVVNGTTDTTSYYRSLGDRLFQKVGRRTDKPEPSVLPTKDENGKAFSISEQATLAYRFALRDPNGSTSLLEQKLPQSIVGGTGNLAYSAVPTQPFAPGNIGVWYTQLFDFVNEDPQAPANPPYFRPRRSLLTVSNPETALVHGADLAKTGTYDNVTDRGVVPAAGTGERMAYYDPDKTKPTNIRLPTKCSANTASFSELWRGFWNVMVDPGNPANAKFGAVQVTRPAYRDAGSLGANATFAGWDGTQQMILRSAQAAVNLLDLRDDDGIVDDAATRAEKPGTISMRQILLTGKDGSVYKVNVFGTERQPFFSRVVMTNTVGNESADFMAVELYNPYDHDLVLPQNWYLCAMSRSGAAATTPFKYLEIAPIPAGTVIKSHASRVFYDPPGTTPPAGITLPDDAIPASNLSAHKNHEIVLLRPRRADGQLSADDPSTKYTVEPDEGAAGASHPVFENMVPLDSVFVQLHEEEAGIYVMERPTTVPWKCVYQDPKAQLTKFTGLPPLVLGSSTTPTVGPTIQIYNDDWPTPTPFTAGHPYYPYGGFARLGDLLQVPYIGSWTINAMTTDTTPVPGIVEMGTISSDAYYARAAAGPADNESVGRFFSPNPATFGWDPQYNFGRSLFDFFTVAQHPWDDYLPNAPTISEDILADSNYKVAHSPANRLPQSGPFQGLININTAPQKVLATLPWMPPLSVSDLVHWDTATHQLLPGAGAVHVDDNEDVANAICYFRDYSAATGVTFQSIADLMDVPAVGVAGKALTTPEPDDAQGDLTPSYTTTANPSGKDGVLLDYEDASLVLTRVSNLITTRSDTFTCYILLQGYRYGGTSAAELVVERRAAFILDRSMISPDVATPTITRVPTN